MGVKIIYREDSPWEETPSLTVGGSSATFPLQTGLSGLTPYTVSGQTYGYALLNTYEFSLSYAEPQVLYAHSGICLNISSDVYPTAVKISWTGVQLNMNGSIVTTTLTTTAYPTAGGQQLIVNPYRYNSSSSQYTTWDTTYAGLRITIYAISDSGARATLAEVTRGLSVTWTDADLLAEPVIHECAEPAGLAMPYDTSEFEVSLSRPTQAYVGADPVNITPRFTRMDRIQYYYTQDGESDIFLAEHYIDSVKHAKYRYEISAMSAVGALADVPYYGGVYYRHYSASGLGAPHTWLEVFQDVVGADMTVTLDAAYTEGAGAYVDRVAVIPPGNRRDALAALALGVGATVRSNGWGIIVTPLAEASNPTEISSDTILTGGEFEFGPEVSSVMVKRYANKLSQEHKQLFSASLSEGQHRLVLSDLMNAWGTDMYQVTGATAEVPDMILTYYLDVTVETAGTVTVTGGAYSMDVVDTKEFSAQGQVSYQSSVRPKAETIEGSYLMTLGPNIDNMIQQKLVPYIMATPDKYTGRIMMDPAAPLVCGQYVTLTQAGSGTITGWITSLEKHVRRKQFVDIEIAGTITEETT